MLAETHRGTDAPRNRGYPSINRLRRNPSSILEGPRLPVFAETRLRYSRDRAWTSGVARLFSADVTKSHWIELSAYRIGTFHYSRTVCALLARRRSYEQSRGMSTGLGSLTSRIVLGASTNESVSRFVTLNCIPPFVNHLLPVGSA